MLIKESGPVFLFMCDSGALGLNDWFHISETFGIMTFIAGCYYLWSAKRAGGVSFLADNKQLDIADAIYGIGLISDDFLL